MTLYYFIGLLSLFAANTLATGFASVAATGYHWESPHDSIQYQLECHVAAMHILHITDVTDGLPLNAQRFVGLVLTATVGFPLFLLGHANYDPELDSLPGNPGYTPDEYEPEEVQYEPVTAADGVATGEPPVREAMEARFVEHIAGIDRDRLVDMLTDARGAIVHLEAELDRRDLEG